MSDVAEQNRFNLVVVPDELPGINLKHVYIWPPLGEAAVASVLQDDRLEALKVESNADDFTRFVVRSAVLSPEYTRELMLSALAEHGSEAEPVKDLPEYPYPTRAQFNQWQSIKAWEAAAV